MLKVGYIGLGLMGKPMARNILKAGYPLIVFNRSQAAVDELVAQGARRAESAKAVAQYADVVFTNLPDSPDVMHVLFDDQGILSGAREGLIFVDNSTIKPSVARNIAVKLAEKGVIALDAPVSGGQLGAENGTLTIMVGGPLDALQTVMPIFNAIGKKVTHVGDSGAGQIAKAANQIMVAAQMVAEGELMVFAQKAGVDVRKVIEAIREGSAQCWTLDVKPQRLLSGIHTPGFKASMQAKDLNIILETAREYQIPLPSAAVDAQLFNSMVAQHKGDLDNSAVISIFEELAGIKLQQYKK